jgi:hypothetical protein
MFKLTRRIVICLLMFSGPLLAQDAKPVPKGSVRVSIPGCSRGYVFTTGPRTADEAGSAAVPDGLHLRMNGPKKLINEIKAHEGSMVVITGTMKEGQFKPGGVGVGGGVRVGPSGGPGGVLGNPIANQIMIDVEGWRPSVGNCPSR